MVHLTAKNKPGARPPGLAPPFLFACVAREHTFSGEEGHLLSREVFTRYVRTRAVIFVSSRRDGFINGDDGHKHCAVSVLFVDVDWPTVCLR